MPGEFILTFPGSYHAGFSTGLNIGEEGAEEKNDYGEEGEQIEMEGEVAAEGGEYGQEEQVN